RLASVGDEVGEHGGSLRAQFKGDAAPANALYKDGCAAPWRPPHWDGGATVARIADGRLHHLYRQQELFLLVAARLADAEAVGRPVRGGGDPAARDGDAHHHPAPLAL